MKGLNLDIFVDEMNRVSELITYKDSDDAAYMAGYGSAIIQLLTSFAEMIDDDLADQ
jgi:hypothetical protein